MSETISIIVPCYNMADKVAKCIDSLKVQSYTNFIAYMIDDGSKDQTEMAIKSSIQDDPRFRYIYKKNGGLSDARNYGMKLIDTEFVTFVDSDDYVSPVYLEKLFEPFQETGMDLTAGYFKRVYEDHVRLNTLEPEDLILSKHPSAWAKMYRMSIIRKHNITFPVGLWYEDLCFFNLYMKYVEKTAIIREPLYYYIQNPNSIMYTYSDKIFDIYQILAILKENNVDRDRLEYIFIYHLLIGTIFRISFMDSFSRRDIADVYQHVEKDFPHWHQNPNIKKRMSCFYQVYLQIMNMKMFGLISIVIKMFHNHIKMQEYWIRDVVCIRNRRNDEKEYGI